MSLSTVIHRSTDKLLAWDCGGFHMDPSVNGVTLPRAGVLQYRTSFDEGFFRSYDTSGLSNGKYSLDFGSESRILVISRNIAPAATVNPGFTESQVQAALNTGNVTFLPGEYRIKSGLVIPSNRNLRCYGATFTTTGTPQYREALFVLGDNVSMYGATLIPTQYCFTSRIGSALYMKDCTIRNGVLGHWGTANNLVVEDCEFLNASAGYVTTGLWLRCKFRGVCSQNHAMAIWGGGNLCIADSTFDETDRGLVFASNWAPIQNVLVTGVKMLNITGIDGGCEVLSVEGGGTGVTDSLFWCMRVAGCDGPFGPWDAPFHRNKFFNCRLDDCDITFGIQAATRNEFHNCEIRRGQVAFGPNHTDNLLEKCVFVGGATSRRNGSTNVIVPQAEVVRASAGSRNRMNGCTFANLPAGVSVSDGVDVS